MPSTTAHVTTTPLAKSWIRACTPKSFSCTFSRIFPTIVYSFVLFVLPACSTLHFATLNSSIHCFAHTVHLSRCCLPPSSFVTSMYSLVSSANVSTLLWTSSSMSLMNIRKRVGPRTDPCGHHLKRLSNPNIFHRSALFGCRRCRLHCLVVEGVDCTVWL